MQFSVQAICICVTFFLMTSCGDSSSAPQDIAAQEKPPTLGTATPVEIPITGTIGNFEGEFINKETVWTKNYADGTSKIRKKAIRLSIDQSPNKIDVVAWDGIGTTGITIISYDDLAIDTKTQALSKKDYSFTGVIGENAFEITSKGENLIDHSTSKTYTYSIVTKFVRTSKTTGHLKIHMINVNSYPSEDIYEGDFTLE